MDYVATIQTKVRFTAKNETDANTNAKNRIQELFYIVVHTLNHKKTADILNGNKREYDKFEIVATAVEDMIASIEVCDVKPVPEETP